MTTFAATAAPRVDFFHPAGQSNVRPGLNALISGATKSFRAAVCFFTEAGRVLLSRHESRLKLLDSYFVASVDFPTNLKSLKKLHQMAPGHIYIHLGGTTPEEKGVGRSLMHSKVLLGESDEECQLWVGSHNLTAMAVAGGNFEAGLLISAHTSSQVIRDASAHLEACRTTAELFNPDDMRRYQEIQNRRRRESEWDIERFVLVIHAETTQLPSQSPFITHIQLVPTQYDRLFGMDRKIRLFLHPRGTLNPGRLVDYDKALLWTGEITAVVRTDLHPENRGASGQFANAIYEIDIPDLFTVPVMVGAGQSRVRARTQVVMRLDERGEPGAEVFSLHGRSPIENVLESAAPLEMHEADADMLRFFTNQSLDAQTLLYRPATGIRQELRVTGYEETLRAALPRRFRTQEVPDAAERVQYTMSIPENPIDSFLFLSSYVIRPRQPR
jgi:hypothetical protein